MFDVIRFERRLKSLERAINEQDELLSTLSDDVASLKRRIASISASYAVSVRETKKKSPAAEDILGELLGGKVVAMGEKEND